MELSSVNLSYKLLALHLFLCLFITSTKSQLNYTYFNYTETKLADCSKVQGMSLEQQLRIRVILRNGTVKEIDPDLKLDPINYCLLNNTNTKYEIKKNNNIIVYLKDKNNNTNILRNIVNPISIYPLQKPFILVTYVNGTIYWNGTRTNSSDYSDPTSYMEWGAVIDWDGKTRSLVPFPGFWINSTIQPNANNKFGFIRYYLDHTYSSSLQQYSSDDSGNLTLMSGVFSHDLNNPLVTMVSTLNNGYLVFYNDTINNNDKNSLLSRGGLYVQIISYNHSGLAVQWTYAYQISQPNMTINSVYCDTLSALIYCIVSVNINNTTRYIFVQLSQSGLSTSIPSEIYNLPNVTGLSHQGWRAKIMPFDGYILGLTAYDDNDHNTYHYIYPYYNIKNTQIPLKFPNPFLTNYFGANVIMDNNTLLLASQYTTNNASWSLLTIQLPNAFTHPDDIRYDNPYIMETFPPINANVSSSTTTLNISLDEDVALSTGNITIYKVSDNSVRQRVSATMNEFCKIDNKFNVTIKVINSTFNEYGEQYFVTMDDNFIKDTLVEEPLKGIHDGIWILKTDDRKIYLDVVVMGSVRLTIDASKTFLTRSENNKSEYINNLLNEIANKVPINSSRLKSNKSKNYRFHKVSDDKIVISIRIDMINETKRDASEISSDLNTMIVYKYITTFYSGVTNDLDESYGFKTTKNAWNENKILISAGIAIYIIFCLLFRILSYKSKSKKIEAISSAILRLGLIIPNFILTILFVVNYSNDAGLYWQSVLVLSVSLFTNICLVTHTIYKGIKKPVIGEDFKEWVKKYLGLVILLIILIATDYEYLTILKDIPIFTKRLYRYEEINRFNIFKHIFIGAIICGAFFDIFFRNIPQIVIQVFYYNEYNHGRLLEYDIVPLLLLVTSCLKIFMIIFNYVLKVITLVLIR
ncbi:hypothetical protein C2G38_418510 [Gigaspora rosea]|uniref:G-protein coupled receptors family 3 profile domain-containing protein n=1 Tax=Gigaspora rosea TaxID=44941 RepID=A0A397UBE2_9GLOM|nr:hypothetical protein C2G38_418510 [Gigaspora rosea]